MIKAISFRTNSINVPMYIGATVADVDDAVDNNREFKKLLWSGKHMQIYAMSIPRGEETGIETHTDNDQYIKIESGRAKILLGGANNEFNYERIIDDDSSVMIPSNTPYNIINAGNEPLKLLSIYAPILV